MFSTLEATEAITNKKLVMLNYLVSYIALIVDTKKRMRDDVESFLNHLLPPIIQS